MCYEKISNFDLVVLVKKIANYQSKVEKKSFFKIFAKAFCKALFSKYLNAKSNLE